LTLVEQSLKYNNPCFIQKGFSYTGEIGQGFGNNSKFAIFNQMVFGIRAQARSLQVKILRGDNTIEKIITQRNPSFENPVEEIIRSIVQDTSFKRDEVLKNTTDTILSLLKAILIVEMGRQNAKEFSQQYKDEILVGVYLSRKSLPTKLTNVTQALAYFIEDT
jgi:hypothetical protein